MGQKSGGDWEGGGLPWSQLPCSASVTLSSSWGLRSPQPSQCIKKGLKAAQWL